MIDSKQAVLTAKQYLKDIFMSDNHDDNISDSFLEELLIDDYKDIKDCWLITLSFYKKKTKLNGNLFEEIMENSAEPYEKILKTVIISPEGRVLGMKIREVEYAF